MTVLQALGAWVAASIPLAILFGTWLRRAGGARSHTLAAQRGAPTRRQSPQLAHRS